MYSPAWVVPREAAKATMLGGYRIPKGAYVFLSPYAMHRHPDYWEDPETFDPSRFGADKGSINKFAYFPFLRGQRQCIGDRFSLMESMLLLATIVQRFRFSVAPSQQIELEPGVTLRTREGIKLVMTPR